MSTRDITEDLRVVGPTNPNGVSVGLYGHLYTCQSSGGNQVSGQPLTDHPYSCTILDAYTALIQEWRYGKNNLPSSDCGEIKGWYRTLTPALPALERAWTSADDYRLYGRLQELYDQGDFNALVFAGELGETVDMLADRTRQFYTALKHAKKGNFADAAKVLAKRAPRELTPEGPENTNQRVPKPKRHKNTNRLQDPARVSQGWLELQYGWKPLLSDIYSLSDTIAKRDKPRKRRIRARHSIRYETSGYVQNFNTRSGGIYGKQIIATVTEDIPAWPEALGLTNPELLAWELLPFSFVADWFLPIGSYLEARSFASRAKGVFVMTTFSNPWCALSEPTLKGPVSCYDGGPKPGTGKDLALTKGFIRKITVNRTVVTTLPQVQMPSFQNGLGKGNRLLNALALIGSIFGPKNFFGKKI